MQFEGLVRAVVFCNVPEQFKSLVHAFYSRAFQAYQSINKRESGHMNTSGNLVFYDHMTVYTVTVGLPFYPWFNFYFPLFLCMVMCDNEFKTKENKNCTKDKIEPHCKVYSCQLKHIVVW